MIAWLKQHPFVRNAGIAVGAIWLVCFAVATWRALASPSESGMATFGQFGDTFGSINALFTGLALVGLGYTVLQQQKQLQQQESDSQENHRALEREKREQFLTARLNAWTALLHAQEVKAQMLPADDFAGSLRSAVTRELSQLRSRLTILLYEVKIGFERDWDLDLERDAIRNLLIEFFVKHKLIFDSLDDWKADYLQQGSSGILDELRSLALVAWMDHEKVSTWINDRVGAINPLGTTLTSENVPTAVERIEEWFEMCIAELSDPKSSVWAHGRQSRDMRPVESS